MLFSLVHKHKHKHKKNKHVRFSCAYAYAFALMFMWKLEQHKTNKWVGSSYVSAYAYASVAVVLTCYAYVLVRHPARDTRLPFTIVSPGFHWSVYVVFVMYTYFNLINITQVSYDTLFDEPMKEQLSPTIASFGFTHHRGRCYSGVWYMIVFHS